MNSTKNKRVSVIGSGSWATSIVKILHETQDCVGWYIREPEIIGHLQKHHNNPNFSSTIEFDIQRIAVSNDINQVVRSSDILVFVVPAQFLKVWMEPLTERLDGKFIVSAIKGIIPDDNLTIAEYFNRRHDVPYDRIGIVSGPSHAEEVAQSRLTYLTFSCKHLEMAEELARIFGAHYIKSHIGTDIYGTEYSAILKNIYALAAGIAHGLGYGDNFLSVLVTNSLLEMERFLNSSYPSPRQLNTSAYMGDLLVTAYSQFSRNRTFGTMIGKGYSVNSTILEMNMVAEGYNASKCMREINRRYNVKMPIAEAVYSILYEKISPAIEMRLLTEQLI
ncbi:MAG: NAD(P)H-dependent glycerol-3-phosphate dehydrogenase [Bacteroidales bacterium]|nr:NAD(P)H-dependent glycerol-3-phosphate dehydrogenase [Bacteroidales bacterium]